MGVTLERVAFASREYRRTATATDSGTEARDLFAEKLTFQTLLKEESDAEDLRDSILAMRSPGKKNWTIQVLRSVDTSKLGDTVTLTTDTFGIGTGNFLVKSKRIQLDSLYNFLTLYGPE